MALKFKCNHCGNEIISEFLKVGEKIKCKSCGKISTIPEDAEVISESQQKKDNTNSDVYDVQSESSTEKTQSKYPALITISEIYKYLAILVGISSFIGLIYGINLMSEYGGGTLIIIYSLIAGLLVVIFLLAISEGIKLFISIEKNTSNQNKLLDKLIDKIK